MWVIDLAKQYWKTWLNDPLGTLTAFVLALIILAIIFRMRYQGKIDTLEERIRHRDDQIKFKDEAIQAQSANTAALAAPPAPVTASMTVTEEPDTVKATAKVTPSPPKQPFEDINARIMKQTEEAIQQAVLNNRYQLTYNPITNKTKRLVFLPDGSFSEGRNDNEHTWRIVNARLEILNVHGQVYSRFFLIPGTRGFHHTNDQDTLSIRGQFMNALLTR
jgi:hypothetical protein